MVFDKGPVARLVAAMDKGFALAKMHGKKKGEVSSGGRGMGGGEMVLLT